MKSLVINSVGSFTFDSMPEFDQIDLRYACDKRSYMEGCVQFYKGNAILLLEGGEDINPKLYGERNAYSYFSDYRDTHEIELFELARELHIPILGICRGHQLMCALAGGSLYQDIGRQVGTAHRSSHPITFTADATVSGFTELMQSNPTGNPAVVNSLHHQAVKRVPDEGKVLARHADGTAEAIIYPWGLSVQWHPEFLGHTQFLSYMRDTFLTAPEVAGEKHDSSVNNLWA